MALRVEAYTDMEAWMLSNTGARLISVDNHTGPMRVVHRVSMVGLLLWAQVWLL